MLFGENDSSIGSLGGSIFYLRGANVAFRYLGQNGEKTYRTFSSGTWSDARSLVFDGGAYGGLERAGNIACENASIHTERPITNSKTEPAIVNASDILSSICYTSIFS